MSALRFADLRCTYGLYALNHMFFLVYSPFSLCIKVYYSDIYSHDVYGSVPSANTFLDISIHAQVRVQNIA
jgi:hypothetical protein